MTKSRLLGFLLLTMALTAAFLYRPRPSGPTPCMSKNLFNVSCPGCGLTRSVVATAHGDWVAALRWHAFGPPLFLATAVAWVLMAVGLIRGRDYLPDINSKRWTAVIVGSFVLLILYWVGRLITGTCP